MPTWKNRRCLSSSIVLSVVLSCATATAALAQPGDAPAEELYLEVTLNSVATGQLARFVLRGGALSASPETLREIGLKTAPSRAADGLVALGDVDGLQVDYDARALRLALLAPVEALDRPLSRFGARLDERAPLDPDSRAAGLVVNYDLFGQDSAGLHSLSAFTETRLFGLGPGVWSNTMTSSAESAPGMAARHRNIRLDSYWQRDFPDEALSLTVGDLTTGALSWSRAARVGGIRLSSNFALQPYRVTTPLALFAGSALLPSTVDLFINGLKQSSQNVQPGQFQLSGVPSLGGAGQAQMVITDINGQSRTVNFDLYGAPQLLEQGLADWSLDLGTVRRDYGIASASYGGALASASGRYGLSAATTIEGHAEAGAGVLQAGAGAVWRLGSQAGLLSSSLALSRQSRAAAGESGGRQHALGYQWNSQRFTLSLATQRRSIGFRDVAATPGELPARGSDTAYLGVSMARFGQLGFSLIRQNYFDAKPARYAGFGWTWMLRGSASLSLNVNRNLDDTNGSTLYLSWQMPLERQLTVAANWRRSGDSERLAFEASRMPSDADAGGFGWRVLAGAGDSVDVQGQVSQLGRYGQWTAGVNRLGGSGGAPATQSVYASANGGLLFMQGRVRASRRVDDAFALVSTSGVPGVPVRLENRTIGETDANGMLFVTQLNAYQKNRLEIDTLNLPADLRISRSAMDAVPESRSGMLASFGMRRILALQFSLRDAAGEWIEAGSRVSGAGASADSVVGYDGLVYLEDPQPGARLQVQLGDGQCRVELPAELQPHGLQDLGVLTCRQQAPQDIPAKAPP